MTEIRFYKDEDPASAGDRKFMARHERGGAGLCLWGRTRKEVAAKVEAWAEKEAQRQQAAPAKAAE